MRNSEFLPTSDSRAISYFAKFTAYTVPLLMLIASLFAFEKTTDPHLDMIHNFFLKETRSFPSMNITVSLYEHNRFKCPFLHIETLDTHNFFSTTVRTTPSDNSGALKVLQHMVMQGSEKYPIRNLFHELKKRSFVNLLTSYSSNEWTAFPFSSTSLKDFNNVIDVYFDAILHPLINNETFYSECHRLEFETPGDTSSPLKHEGTMYKEVHEESFKTNLRFSNLLKEKLYPDSLFKNSFSGTPDEISHLTLNSLKQFHNRYYHPSNLLFFHYGSFPVESILEHISKAIDSFPTSTIPSDDSLYVQPQFKFPHAGDVEGQLDENTQPEKIRAAVSWMCGDLRNISDMMDLEFLSILLTHSTTSPLYRGLIKTELGSKFFETGFFPSLRTPYFSIGLEGFNPTFMNFNQTVLALLNQIYKKGFDSNRVKSLLNRHEIRQKTITASQGLKIWKSIINSWIHGTSPFELIDPTWEIERLKKLLSVQPHYFEMVMKQKLIDNNHRFDMSMHGVKYFNEEIIKSEKEELVQLKLGMAPNEEKEIAKIADLVNSYKNSPKDTSILPAIKVNDIKLSQSINPTAKQHVINNSIFVFETNLNGLVYVELKAKMPLGTSYIEDIPLLKAVLTDVGAGNLDEDSFSTQQQLYTGGLKCDLVINPENPYSNDVEAYFIIKGSALSKNIEHLYNLMENMLLNPWLNNTDQIAVLLSMFSVNSEDILYSSGTEYVSKYSAAGFSSANALNELLTGFSAIKKMSQLVHNNDWSSISMRIQQAYQYALRMSNFTAMIHCDDNDYEEVFELTQDLLNKLNAHETKSETKDFIQNFLAEIQGHNKVLITADTQSYHSCITIQGPKYHEPNSAAYAVAVSVIQTEFLYPTISEKLELGSIHSNYDPILGTITFSSAKNKNPSIIFSYIENSILAVSTGIFDDSLVENAIIHVISNLDMPIPPSEAGSKSFRHNITYENQMKWREEILKVVKDDVVIAANNMFLSEKRYAIYGPNQESLIPTDFHIVDIAIDEEVNFV